MYDIDSQYATLVTAPSTAMRGGRYSALVSSVLFSDDFSRVPLQSLYDFLSYPGPTVIRKIQTLLFALRALGQDL
jgi:hypothetical protein